MEFHHVVYRKYPFLSTTQSMHHGVYTPSHIKPRDLHPLLTLWPSTTFHTSHLLMIGKVKIVSFQMSEPLWCDFHGFWIHSSTEVGWVYFWCITWHQIPLPLYILQILLASKYFAKKLRIIQPPSPDIFQNHYSIPCIKGDTLLIPSSKLEYTETNLPWLL